MITRDSLVCRKSDILAADVGGEVVLMSVSQWHYFGLNAIGSEIWKRLETRQSVADLCAGLAADYEGDAGQIERDVIALLDKLAGRNLLEPSV